MLKRQWGYIFPQLKECTSTKERERKREKRKEVQPARVRMGGGQGGLVPTVSRRSEAGSSQQQGGGGGGGLLAGPECCQRYTGTGSAC